MRIISKFHDYYDRAQAQGQDLSRVFVRQPVVHQYVPYQNLTIPALFDPLRALLHNPMERKTADGLELRADTFLIGFCGKLYPGVRVAVTKGVGHPADVSLTYDYTQLDELCGRHGIDLKQVSSRTRGNRAQRFSEFFGLRGVARFPDLLGCAEHAIVYVANYPGCVVAVNPMLRDLQFFRLFDAFAAFQELEMFIGNIAQPSDAAMVQLTDAQRVAKHGFDRFSFRKPPQDVIRSRRR